VLLVLLKHFRPETDLSPEDERAIRALKRMMEEIDVKQSRARTAG